MKAISLWQPWAQLVALGLKRIETRSRGTPYRGPLVIHAAKRWDMTLRAHAEQMLEHAKFLLEVPEADVACLRNPPRGAYVAIADLVDVFEMDEAWVDDEVSAFEWLAGHHAVGRFGWRLEHVRPITPPVPAVGRQWLWTPGDLPQMETAVKES